MEEIKVTKCKTCGEPLDMSTAKDGVLECKFCATVYTLPKNDSSPEAYSYLNLGEHELDVCNWEGAISAFKKALENSVNEPEVYWGLARANYKVQFIKDEVNNRLQPICHELSSRKFVDSLDYQKALTLATYTQKKEYEKKAQEIDYIKEEFYNLSQSGLDFDSFICVKVTGADGGKTEDYKDAEYIYDLLKNKGYSPFFSERSIRNRTGADYEAMILYALYSAETMLVVCRNEEYLQTPWVKNEYTRFLRLINDEEKDSDSITFVYNGKPIDRLPGRQGKLQGIDFANRGADNEILDFVERHTPEARARREEEAKKKQSQSEEQEKRLKEMQEQLEAQRKMFERMEAERLEREQSANSANSANSAGYTNSANPSNSANQNGGIFNGLFEMGSSAISNGITKIGDAIQGAKERVGDAVSQFTSKAKSAVNGEPQSIWDNEHPFQIENGVLIKYVGRQEKVVIPEEVNIIGKEAFKNCKTMVSVTIPQGVTTICEGAFSGCSALKEVHISDLNAWYRVEIKDGSANPLSSGHNLYLNDVLVTDIEIPSGKSGIGDFTFYGCSSIKNVTLPESVTSIGRYAFSGCKITEVKLPDGVTKIGEYAFSGCTQLKGVTLPESVTSIGKAVFSNCLSLTSITIPKKVTSIEMFTFDGCASLKSLVIPDGVKTIGDFAFRNCTALTSIALPTRLTSIGNYAISGCVLLKSIVVPVGVASIGANAFKGNKSLETVVIPKTVTAIGNETFFNCPSLTSVKLPQAFKEKRKNLFSEESLKVFGKCKISYI
ncbi:MAG: leucine-rich repeat protein [Candidatus Coproplasma sp.]